MTAMPPLRDILNDTHADAIHVDFNFNTIEAHVATELINRDGSVAMTGPLSLPGPPTAPQHAATKAYVDTAQPVGSIVMFAGATAPAGWTICNGDAKATTDPMYAALFAVIGTTYNIGGEAVGTFRLPNLTARLPVGRLAADGSFGTLGQAGGVRDAIIPPHTHPLNDHNHYVDHSHTVNGHHHSLPAHQHSMKNHSHDSQVRHGYTMNSANLPGTTNAIYPAQGNTALIFDSRASAICISQLDGANHQQTGGPSDNISDFNGALDSGDTAPGTSTMAGRQYTDNVSGGPGSTQGAAGATAVANANLPPYLTLNFIIRIGI